jgi:hypothetical protein
VLPRMMTVSLVPGASKPSTQPSQVLTDADADAFAMSPRYDLPAQQLGGLANLIAVHNGSSQTPAPPCWVGSRCREGCLPNLWMSIEFRFPVHFPSLPFFSVFSRQNSLVALDRLTAFYQILKRKVSIFSLGCLNSGSRKEPLFFLTPGMIFN